MLLIEGTARFISDLHLRPERPDLTERFARFLADCAQTRTGSLFILGDLFEYWIGDDNLTDPFIAQVIAQLRDLSDRGTRLYFSHGNRDFLIGDAFSAACGMTVLPELQKVMQSGIRKVGAGDALKQVSLGDTAILLLHGDTLCIDDHAYQDFRHMVRSMAWQRDFLAQPLESRRAEVELLRARSTEAVHNKAADIMDANPRAVRQALADSACQRMIHGHTHRPGHELLDVAAGTERWVLSDWDIGRGDALELDANQLRRLDWSH